MSLISLSEACLSLSDTPLLYNTELYIDRNEFICLVGRNGTGKSTLMKILNRELLLDDGKIIFAKNLITSRLPQELPQYFHGNVFDFVSQGVKKQLSILKLYFSISRKIGKNPDNKNIKKIGELIEVIDKQNLWHLRNNINNIINKVGLDANSQMSSLSGGYLRRAALGRALICKPQILFLDEPTNHLDITSIEWLENFLKSLSCSIFFISHDRSFIKNLSTRIIDLDRGKLKSWPANYSKYLKSKENEIRIQSIKNTNFDRKLAKEEVWIRQGIKARCKRNEGRVRALKLLRENRRKRREIISNPKMYIPEAQKSGKIVFELNDINYKIEDKTLIKNFSAYVQRGDKIAFIGKNGTGKTTLLQLMLGNLKTNIGQINIGTKLKIAYFDQYREILDPEKTLIDNLSNGRQELIINGRPRHLLGYLQDFLFHPKQSIMLVKTLSGGERNRLLLAKLFLFPSNLLILDEPTNDLDIETLDILEGLIYKYQGTVILISHDREFIDNSATECWVFEGDGNINIYIGGYTDIQYQYNNVSK